MLDRLNDFWTRLGIKPAVGNAFVTTVVLCVANWIAVGGPFDWNEVKTAVALLLLGVVGVASPPSIRTKMTKGGVRPADPLRRR